MADLSWQWQGIEEAQRRIQALAAQRGLDGEIEAAADDILPIARTYPAEVPGQIYRRRFYLQGNWTRGDARRAGGVVAVDIRNPTEYGEPVMGDEQAPAFKDRWKPLRTIGQEQRGAVRARCQAWALRIWRGG